MMSEDGHLPQGRTNTTFLKRKIQGLPPYFMELLQRNWHIIKDVTAVFAFGEFSSQQKSQLRGGTGWPVQMALDANKTVYLYDTNPNVWYQPFHYRWNEKGEWVKEFYFAPIGHTSWLGQEPSVRSYPTFQKISAIVFHAPFQLKRGMRSGSSSIEHCYWGRKSRLSVLLWMVVLWPIIMMNEFCYFFRCRPTFPHVTGSYRFNAAEIQISLYIFHSLCGRLAQTQTHKYHHQTIDMMS